MLAIWCAIRWRTAACDAAGGAAGGEAAGVVGLREGRYGGISRRVASTVAATVPGSYLLISHPAIDVEAETAARVQTSYNQNVATTMTRRTRDEVTRFFEGLEIQEPGVVQHHRWRPEPGAIVDDYEVPGWSVLGRKP